MVTPKELAEKAGVTPQYITQLCRAGKLKASKPGRDWFIPDEEAERWLRDRQERAGKGG